MDWYQKLYIGETASKKKESIIQKVENRQNMMFVYLITVAPGERNQLEILAPEVLYRQEKRYGAPLIVGIAWGMREAKGLLVQITQDVYRETGTAELRNYFCRSICRCNSEEETAEKNTEKKS